MNCYVVQDRFHYSEPMYTAATRPNEPALLSPRAYDQVERQLRNHASFTVVITADPVLLTQRYDMHREMYSLQQVLAVNKLYMEAAREGRWGAYSMPADLWIHCTEDQPFPQWGEHLQLHLYLNRLARDFPYAGATRRIA